MRIKDVESKKNIVNAGERIVITFKVEYETDYPYEYPHDYPIATVKE